MMDNNSQGIDEGLREAYQQTHYWVNSLQIKLEIGDAIPAELMHWLDTPLRTCAIISAFNPFSQKRARAINEKGHSELKECLSQEGFPMLEGLAIDPTAEWPAEANWLVGNIEKANAVHLARLFKQNAIVWWEKGQLLGLVWTGIT